MSARTKLCSAFLVGSMAFFIGQSASAQYKFQNPDGRQTVAPSDMSQQPQLRTELSKPANFKSKTIPPASLDQPGVPGVTMTRTPAGASSPALAMPQGYSSATRIGPLQPVPLIQRAALAGFLMLQFASMIIIAIVLQRTTVEKDNLYHGGHIINEDYKENKAEWTASGSRAGS